MSDKYALDAKMQSNVKVACDSNRRLKLFDNTSR